MGLLLPIITKSIMGNNESIITQYELTQLADVTLLIYSILNNVMLNNILINILWYLTY